VPDPNWCRLTARAALAGMLAGVAISFVCVLERKGKRWNPAAICGFENGATESDLAQGSLD
jgi:hypothetical protein